MPDPPVIPTIDSANFTTLDLYMERKISSLTVPKIKVLLVKLALKKSGNKPVLIERIESLITGLVSFINARDKNKLKGYLVKCKSKLAGNTQDIIDRVAEQVKQSLNVAFAVDPISTATTPVILKSSFGRNTSMVDVLVVLKDTDTYKSMVFSDEVETILFSRDIWEEVMTNNRANVDCCLAAQEGQLSHRRLKLVQLDNTFIVSFAKKFCNLFENCTIKNEVMCCCLYELCHQFISICKNLEYKQVDIHGISDVVENSFKEDIAVMLESSNQKVLETLYYIAGWSLHAMKKAALRRRAGTAVIMNYLVGFCSNTQDEARASGLPTEKIDRVMAFGGLKFPSEKYFEFIYRYEYSLLFYVFVLY